MANSDKRFPKLRFALITEDALEMLRPDQKTQESSLMEVKDMYETINNTVTVLLEQKLRNLKLDKLDQLIEDKVCEILDRHREIRKSLRGLGTPKTSDESIHTVSEFGSRPIRPIKFDARSINSIASRGMRPKKAKKEQFTTDYPYQTEQANERKTTPTNIINTNNTNNNNNNINKGNNRNGIKNGNLRPVATTEPKKHCARDIAVKYFKELDDRCKRKQ
ncbi:putative uncharacterized protein DDB_G0289963 [Drosophila montana]|uniref:putative uncharacterized protein DDB_G0289963 n=1 Tax=Drosophila montana TaxID=40370 RepID=UPI00313F2E26